MVVDMYWCIARESLESAYIWDREGEGYMEIFGDGYSVE